jgi:hypothetical protein
MKGAPPGSGRMANAIAAAALLHREEFLARMATGKKTCPQCRRVLDLSEFGRSPATASGRRGWCKKCTNADARDRRNRLRAGELPQPAEKFCPRCRQTKERSEWGAALGGLRAYCRTCETAYQRQRRAANGQPPTSEPSKVCRSCSRRLPMTSFERNHSSRDGYTPSCKPCRAEADWRRGQYDRRGRERADDAATAAAGIPPSAASEAAARIRARVEADRQAEAGRRYRAAAAPPQRWCCGGHNGSEHDPSCLFARTP